MRKTTYGYKFYINTDEDSFFQNFVYTAANIYDSQGFKTTLTGYEFKCYADSTYPSEKTNRLLGMKNKVLSRVYRNKPLTDRQKFENQ